MKAPKPTAPADAPAGTRQLGGPIEWFSASLQVSGDDLDPDRITRLLARPPDHAQRRGVPLLRADGSTQRIPRFGAWARTLKPQQTDEWDIAQVIRLLFEGLPTEAAVWAEVAALGGIRISLGLDMPDTNRDVHLDPELMRFLGERHAWIWFDIYCDPEDDA